MDVKITENIDLWFAELALHLYTLKCEILCELAEKELELEPGFECELEPSAEPEPLPGSELTDPESTLFSSTNLSLHAMLPFFWLK